MSITVIIIIITSLVSLLAFNNNTLFNQWAHYPYAEHRQGSYYRLLTSGFLHGDLFHLFINMFVLYSFGNYVEVMFRIIHGDTAGKVIYVAFYFLTIVLANLPNYSIHKDNPSFRSIGASGATSAVVFSFILFEPWAMLQLYLFIPVPAIIFAVLYLWYSHWASRKYGDFIDHTAHLYGAIAGFLFTAFMKKDLIIVFFQKLTSILH